MGRGKDSQTLSYRKKIRCCSVSKHNIVAAWDSDMTDGKELQRATRNGNAEGRRVLAGKKWKPPSESMEIGGGNGSSH